MTSGVSVPINPTLGDWRRDCAPATAVSGSLFVSSFTRDKRNVPTTAQLSLLWSLMQAWRANHLDLPVCVCVEKEKREGRKMLDKREGREKKKEEERNNLQY